MSGTEDEKIKRARIVLLAFAAMALVAIVGAVFLPTAMIERAVDACRDGGGTYDRASATCVRG